MIQVQELVKRFGAIEAVRGISFAVQPGEIFAFLGPNGAGKTTTIKMLPTLLQPAAGTIRIDGMDPASHQHEVRRRFGIVFQDPSLDGELTGEENLDLHGVLYAMPRARRQERTELLLRQFELWERRKQPTKFDLIMPLFFLSGALYPLQGLPEGLKVITRLNPLTCGVDGHRAFVPGAGGVVVRTHRALSGTGRGIVEWRP